MPMMIRILFSIGVIAAAVGLTLTPPHARTVLWQHAKNFVVAPTPAPSQETREATPWAKELVSAARAQIGETLIYDGSYVGLSYPLGDVPRERGVCTDVVIRALRDAHAMDLQQLVHEDMANSFASYPANWGLTRPDRNIDHRRVPNLRTYFLHVGTSLEAGNDPTNYLPGDIVTWKLGPGQPHIGIVSDRLIPGTDRPFVIHNVGAGTREEDFLFTYPPTGHYRLK